MLTPWPVTFPAGNTGDLLVVCIGWDDSTTVATVTAPAGPNGEVAQVISGPVASVSTEVRSQVWYYVATGSWAGGSLNFTPSAAESRTAVVIRVPAGEFDIERPIGAAATKADQAATSTSAQTPAFTAGGRWWWSAGRVRGRGSGRGDGFTDRVDDPDHRACRHRGGAPVGGT